MKKPEELQNRAMEFSPGQRERADRITAALLVAQQVQPNREIHCGHCFFEGRNAVLRALEDVLGGK